MTDTANENLQNSENKEQTIEDVKMETPGQGREEEPKETSDNFREASYVVLFIAAVFVINAMETGSYRTPWPVAIVTTLLGFGLLGYSLLQKSRTGQ
jgi:hypothetical protein